MAKFKIHKSKNFTVISNYHLREKEMSLKAKGLLSVMLSLPDNWDYSVAGLVAICAEKESAINATLGELKQFGYLRVDKLMPNQTMSGRIEYVYNIFESPEQAVEKQEVKKQGLEKQALEKQGVEFLGVENQGQLNTKELNTKVLNTKILNTTSNKKNYLLNNSIPNKYIYNNNNNICAFGVETPSARVSATSKKNQLFEEIWELYPRKIGKSVAFKAYQKSLKDGTSVEEIRKGVENYARYCKANNIDLQYIKQGATWFNQRCWQDEYDTRPLNTSRPAQQQYTEAELASYRRDDEDD